MGALMLAFVGLSAAALVIAGMASIDHLAAPDLHDVFPEEEM